MVLDIVRHLTKYRWAPNNINSILHLAISSISGCGLSFQIDNPIAAALDCAFEGGELVDYFIRYSGRSFENLM